MKEEEESQVNTLIYAMGDQADDILNSFKLSTTQLKQYHTVKTKFDEHFVVRRNVRDWSKSIGGGGGGWAGAERGWVISF